MQNESVTEVEFEINPRPGRGCGFQRAEINERRRGVVAHLLAAITPIMQKAAPAMEARRTDLLTAAEGFDALTA